MMKKIAPFLTCIQVIIVFSAFSQKDSTTYSWRAVYNLKFYVDSQHTIKGEENLILLFNQSDAAFYSYATFVYDSLCATVYKNYSQQDLMPIMMRYRAIVPECVYTDLSNDNVTVTSNMLLDEEINPEYTEHIAHVWKTGTEHKMIAGVKCTRADEYLFGRHWIAWFSVDYPMPFGPYKFFGLPGLIFRLEDDRDNYVYELHSVKKYPATIPKREYTTKRIKVTKAKYLEMYDRYHYTPAMFTSPTIISNGMSAEDMERMKAMFKKKKETENNPIELKPLP